MAGALEHTIETDDGGLTIFHLAGRIDITSANDLKRVLADNVGEGHTRLVLDLSEVSFVDSSGLSALVSGLRVARRAGGDLRLAAPGDQPKAVLGLTSLDQIFSIAPTLAEAVDGYS
jgi:anti-sigma B factor antagonist